ncbi:CDP-diacylglycerol diphosphatase [Jejubacter calystegiae]|uniref:CDP-diacylglycerol pyrophosphatase n=1 Tax=Jejubacter calystegiae TaxID=2579935 RepID=A0A4P8YFI8_9ENTR|nr:CDP-diacylglycerol diphosphatase [Jejubacter calystegiae]QCT19280.1 CDP-diacylglycerol diphosphatase [Jejubacter calystegiae]
MRRLLLILLIPLTLLLAGVGYLHLAGHPDALRHIVLKQCLPGWQHGNPAPCTRVTQDAALLKDRNGLLQYLLLPVIRINGIESPMLLDAETPNYFWLAWQARDLLGVKRSAPVPDTAIALTVNSRMGRTQNHLHIHISCLRSEVRAQLNRSAAGVGPRWQPLDGSISGHHYMIRRVSADALSRQSPFRLLANEVPGARAHMGRYGLALALLPDGDFVLLATERHLLRLNLASSEEIQDHDCAILHDS